MSLRYAQIMRRLLNAPLACHPRAAMTFYNGLAGRLGVAPGDLPDTPDAEVIDAAQRITFPQPGSGVAARPRASRFEGAFTEGEAGGGFPRVEPFKITPDGVAIISIVGETVNRGAWVGSNSGLVSYEGIRFQLSRAARSSKVKSILLDIESPGGEGLGAFETSAFVRAVNDHKPVHSVVNGMAASAGYALASGSKRIITGESGIAGSIGVVMLHLDHSKALENKGITPTLIFAGAHKVDGNPLEPLSESVKGELQAEVNSFYQMFVNTVAEGRGRRLSRKAARETEARTYIGQDAVEAGLADAVGTFDDVLSEANALARRSAGRVAAGRTNMALLDDAADGVPKAEHDAAVAKAKADGITEGEAKGKQAGKVEGAADAYSRITTVLASDKVKGKEPYAVNLACKAPTMSADDVISLCEGIPAAAAARPTLAERAEATGANAIGPGTPGPGPSGNAASVPSAESTKNWNDAIAATGRAAKTGNGST
jgi:capsid assembly protease